MQDCAAPQEMSCIQEGLLNLDAEDKARDPAKLDRDGPAAAPDQEANDMTCAICLEQIALEDMCIVKGCEHVYCGRRHPLLLLLLFALLYMSSHPVYLCI